MVEANKAILYFVLVLIATILFGTLATIVAGEANSNDMKADNTFTASTAQSILANNSAILSPIGEGITSSSGTSANDSWLEFDGVNDGVVAQSSDSLNITQNITISLWVNLATTNQISNSYALRVEGDSYGIQTSSGGAQAIFIIQNSSLDYTLTSANGVNLTVGEWTHLVGRYDGTELAMFINGVKNNTKSYAGDIESVTNLNIGSEAVSSGFYSGAIDEARIYNQTLTDSQITEIYNSGRQPNSSLPSEGLVLWYSFNEGPGSTTVYDKSGNSNDGV